MNNYLTSEDNPISGALNADEEIQSDIFQITEKIDEKSYGFNRRYYCTNCRKSTHNRIDNKQICKSNGCDCPCQFFYIGRDGMTFIPYGEKDNTKSTPLLEIKPSKEWDKQLELARAIMQKKEEK